LLESGDENFLLASARNTQADTYILAMNMSVTGPKIYIVICPVGIYLCSSWRYLFLLVLSCSSWLDVNSTVVLSICKHCFSSSSQIWNLEQFTFYLVFCTHG